MVDITNIYNEEFSSDPGRDDSLVQLGSDSNPDNFCGLDKETLLHLWINNISGISRKDIANLLDSYEDIEKIYEAPLESLAEILGDEKANIIFSERNLDKAIELSKELEKKHISITYPGHKSYPQKLLNIYDPPQILYVLGHLRESVNKTNCNISIVGSRIPDSYGRECATMFARELAANDINIISGLAVGIDSCAHRGALTTNGYTIGVLGCGIDQVYPQSNFELYLELEKRGAIISEYAPGVRALKHHFPERNRIISALCDGLLVVEAKKKSGSLITTSLALEQGKQIYAICGRICDSLSQGTNDLIKHGAMAVTNPIDILEDLRGEIYYTEAPADKYFASESTKYDKKITQVKKLPTLTDEERKVYELLSLDDKYIDDIIHEAKIGVTKAISTLLSLKNKDAIRETSKGYYIKTL